MRGRKLEIVLRADQGQEKPPTFIFESPTIATQDAVADAYDAAVKATETKELVKQLIDALTPVLIGWRDMGREYTKPDDLREVISMAELIELAGGFIAGVNLTADDKKKSD
jgi:hypothetical protein